MGGLLNGYGRGGSGHVLSTPTEIWGGRAVRAVSSDSGVCEREKTSWSEPAGRPAQMLLRIEHCCLERSGACLVEEKLVGARTVRLVEYAAKTKIWLAKTKERGC